MRDFVVVCGGEVGAHASVVAGYYHAAGAGGRGGGGEVFGSEAGGGAGFAEDDGIFVFADGAEEEG